MIAPGQRPEPGDGNKSAQGPGGQHPSGRSLRGKPGQQVGHDAER
jgi:hypothetical protein